MQTANLRLANLANPNLNADTLFKKDMCHITYQAGEMILFDNYRRVAIILEVSPENLKVLDQDNKILFVRSQEVSRKVVLQARNANTVDSENNVISRLTFVKIRDKYSHMRGQMGEIRQLFKNTLFLWCKSANLTQSNGYYATTASGVINAGA